MPLGFLKRKNKEDHDYIALDIGTHSVKALVFQTEQEKAVVKGYGQHRQKKTQMRTGMIADLEGVTQNCETAISQAVLQAGITPTRVILGIAGEAVKGFSSFFKFERVKPKSKISEAEFQEMVNRIQKAAFDKAAQELKKETGNENLDLHLVNASLSMAKIDQYEVPTPLGFQGEQIEIGFFNAYAPRIQLENLETLCDDLGLEIFSITAEPFALALSILPEEKESLSAIVIDIGGRLTEISLIKQGKILKTKILPLGGDLITEKIAKELKVSLEEAEGKKIQYSKNELEPTLKRKFQDLIKEEVDLWIRGMQVAIEEFEEKESLPPQFFLCGGGASLPEIKTRMIAFPWLKFLPFPQFPKVDFILPDHILAVFDQSGVLTDHSRVTPMSLCKIALDLEAEEDFLGKTLEKTAKKIGI